MTAWQFESFIANQVTDIPTLAAQYGLNGWQIAAVINMGQYYYVIVQKPMA